MAGDFNIEARVYLLNKLLNIYINKDVIRVGIIIDILVGCYYKLLKHTYNLDNKLKKYKLSKF